MVGRIISDCVKYEMTFVLKNKDGKLKPKHKAQIEFLQNFFSSVNDEGESFSDIRTKFIKDMLVYGRGTIEKVNKGRTLKELYSIKSSQVEVKIDERGKVPNTRSYRQKTGSGKVAYFDKNEIIFKVLDPVAGYIYGEKKLDTLAQLVSADILRSTYNTNFFINGAEASGILSLDKMSRNELNKFKEMWRSNFKGVNNSHKIAAVNVPVNFVRMAVTNKDMEFTEFGQEIKKRIYSVYKMQPFIMGDIDGTTGKLNSSEQKQAYKDGALKPILSKEAEIYTRSILNEGFGITDLKVSFGGIDLEDIKEQASIDRENVNSGILTINEVRSRHGYAPVPWGDSPISHLPGGSRIDPKTGKLTSIDDGGKQVKDESQVKDNEKGNVDEEEEI